MAELGIVLPGDVWRVDAGGDVVDVLIKRPGEQRVAEAWADAYAIDAHPELAADSHFLLDAGELDPAASAPGWRVRVDRPLKVRVAELAERVGVLTDAGRRAWGFLSLGVADDERWGTAELDEDPLDPVIARLEERWLAAAHGPLGTLSLSEVDELSPSDTVVLAPAALDAVWPRRTTLTRGLVAVVDLTDPALPPALLVDARDPALHELAVTLEEDADGHALIRRLVIAESRLSQRPSSPWVLDVALAAWQLADRIAERRRTGAAEPATLHAVRDAAVERSVALVRGLSVDLLGLGTRDGRDLVTAIATSLGPLLATADPTITDWLGTVKRRARLLQAEWDEEIRGALVGHGIDGVLATTLGPGDGEARWVVATLDGALIEAEILRGSASMELVTTAADADSVDARIDVDQSVLEGYDDISGTTAEGAARDPHALAGVWLEAIDVSGGDAVVAARLLVDRQRSQLVGSLALPDYAGPYALHATLEPRRVLDLEQLRLRALASADWHRDSAVAQLRALSQALREPDVESMFQHAAVAEDAARGVAAAEAMSGDGVLVAPTIGGDVLAAVLHRRTIAHQLEREIGDTSAGEERRALDTLLR